MKQNDPTSNKIPLPDQQIKARVFHITDYSYKVLCKADRVNFDPTKGLENIINMFIALSGPVDFDQLEIDRAKAKIKKQLNKN